MRIVESTGLKPRNCFPIFLEKEACQYKLLIPQYAATIVSKSSVWSIQSGFLCGFEKMLNVFREELRVTEAYRKEGFPPPMDPDTCSIPLGQVMATFHRRNKRLLKQMLETDLFKPLLLCICLQFRQTVLLMREKLLILACKTSAWHQSCRYGLVVTGHTSDF